MDTETTDIKLQRLANEAASEGRTFISGYAIRALAILHSRGPGSSLPEGKKAVDTMWSAYFAVRKMYGLHVDQSWDRYYRDLSFWQKRKAKRNEAEWKRNRRIQLENEAEQAVLSIIDDIDYRRIYGQEV